MLDGEIMGMWAPHTMGMAARAALEQLVPTIATMLESAASLVASRLTTLGATQRVFTGHQDVVAHDLPLGFGSQLNATLGVGAQRLVSAGEDEGVGDVDRLALGDLNTTKFVSAFVLAGAASSQSGSQQTRTTEAKMPLFISGSPPLSV